MATLDLGEIQRACIEAHDQSAEETHLRQGVQAALGDRQVDAATVCFDAHLDVVIDYPFDGNDNFHGMLPNCLFNDRLANV